MSISRRHFLLGTSAGLILPSYFDKAVSFFDATGEPLLEVPQNPVTTLYAVDDEVGGFQFRLGSKDAEPPGMTLREFAESECGSLEEYLYEWWGEDPENVGVDDVDWEAEADPELVWDALQGSLPTGAAFFYLDGLDLGSELVGPEVAGGLDFYDGPFPGSNYRGVHATDEVSLSLLQKRLNDLGENVQIELVRGVV